jgi:cell division protein FtsQ
MRLPALPQVRLGWRLASFLLLALLVFALYTLWNSPIYRVETAQVAGLQRLSSTAVNAVAGVSGQPVFAVDTDSVQQSLLQAFPEFSAVSVYVELPNTVVVTVTERVPVLIWRQDGRSSLVDAQGMLFPARNETVEMPYPVVEASGSPPSLSPLPVSSPDLQDLAANLPVGLATWNTAGEAVPFLSEEMVSAILLMAEKAPEKAVLVYDAGRGLGWRDQRGWDVFFGNVLGSASSSMDVKLRVYKAILDRLKAEDVKPALISVEYVDAPYYRLER